MTLEARAQRRAKLIKLAKDTIADRVSKLYLSLFKADLHGLKEGDQIRDGVPVGKDKFIDWVKQAIENFHPEITGILEDEEQVRLFAGKVANLISQSSTEVLNPLRDYSKSEHFIKGKNETYIKKAQYMDQNNDTPAEKKTSSIYEGPKEHSRYCPDHPGSMLRRVSDKVYQCPIGGELNTVEPWKEKFSYSDGHEVKFETGVHNQSNHGWNDLHPIMSFLHPEVSRISNHKGKDYSYEREGLYGVKSTTDGVPPVERQDQRNANLLSKLMKTASYDESFFGPTTMTSRQCPDHPGQQLARIEDNVRQCPLDGKVYDYVRGFYTEDGKAHTGGTVMNQHMIPPGSVIVKKEASTKTAQVNAPVHEFLYNHVLPHLPASAEYARRVLNHKNMKAITLEQAIMEIKQADELAAAQKAAGEDSQEIGYMTAGIKGFTRNG